MNNNNPYNPVNNWFIMESKITTGSADLDLWLSGGYERGVVTLIYGPAGSGKSNFVSLASCYQARGSKVIFIDTEGSFSVERMNQISKGFSEEILKNIVILCPTNFEEQKKSFNRLNEELKLSQNIGLIVVDSITMLYRLELAEARKKGLEYVQDINSALASQMKVLYEVSRKKNIPVLVTSQVYSEFLSEEDWLAGKQAGVSLVGGDILKYWSKCIIEIENKGGKRRALIKKHRSLPEGSLNFDIIGDGIRKRTGLWR